MIIDTCKTILAFILLNLLILVSCKTGNESVNTNVSFRERKVDPFPAQLVSLPFLFDTTFRITLIDANRDGDYFDGDENSVDFITITDKKHAQFSGIAFKSLIQINYGLNSFELRIDTLNRAGVLVRQDKPFLAPDINIFHSISNVELMLQEDTSEVEILTSILNNINSEFVFVSFWADYCVGCIEEMEFYSLHEDEINSQGLTVIYVSRIERIIDSNDFLEKRNFKGGFYVCYEDTEVELNCKGYPNGLLFDSEGNYIRHFSYSSVNDILNYLSISKKRHINNSM